MPTLWHYFLLTVFSLVGVLVVILLARLHRNIRRIDSPESIILQIQGLSKEFSAQHRHIKDLKSRIQKTENTFIKVLSHHIDDKYSSLAKDVDMQFQDFYGANKTMLSQYHEINARLSQVEGLLVSLKEFVSEQKQDIKRLHEGSDWIHASSYLLGLISVVDRIDVELEDIELEDERDRLTELRESIVILLEAHSVRETAPEVGSKLESDTVSIYRIVHIHADKPDQKGRVARVHRPSFVYTQDEQPLRVIREAEIEVYS